MHQVFIEAYCGFVKVLFNFIYFRCFSVDLDISECVEHRRGGIAASVVGAACTVSLRHIVRPGGFKSVVDEP